MAITYHYKDYQGGAFNVDLGESVRLGAIDGLVENAELGLPGNSNLTFDDPDSTLGYNSDGLVGWKLLLVKDTAAPVGNRVVFAGLIGARTYRSGDSLNQGVAAKVTPALLDLNALVDLRQLKTSDWKRPAESAKVRLEALLASNFMSGITDQGLVTYSHHELDKTDYRGQRPAQVLNDIVTPLNWNWFIKWNEDVDGPELVLGNLNRSDDWASDLRLSNDASDIDSVVDPLAQVGYTGTFAVLGYRERPSVLSRDPDRVYSGVRVPYGKHSIYVEKEKTKDAFIARDGTAPSGNIKHRAAALRLANRYLDNSDTEADRIDTSVMLPAANVNDIRAGHLIEAKFRNLKSYGDFSYFRVVKRIVRQPDMDDRYVLDLTLVPAKPFSCIGLTDINEDHGTMTGEVAVEDGFVTWAHATIPCLLGFCDIFPPDDPVGFITVSNPPNANDGDTGTYSGMLQSTLRGAGTVAVYWTSTLDGTYTICSIKGTNEYGNTQWRARPPTSILYWDGSDWQTAAGDISLSNPYAGLPQWWTFTLRTPVDTNKVRLRYAQTGVPVIAGLWNFMPLGLRLWEMQIYGEAV